MAKWIRQSGQCKPRLLAEQIYEAAPVIKANPERLRIETDRKGYIVRWEGRSPTVARMQEIIDAHDPAELSKADLLQKETEDAQAWLRQQYVKNPDSPLKLTPRQLIALLGMPRVATSRNQRRR